MYFQIWKSNNLWHWHLRSDSHEITKQGDPCDSKRKALRAVNLANPAGGVLIYDESRLGGLSAEEKARRVGDVPPPVNGNFR